TTGRSFNTTILGLTETSFAQNGQVDMIGESGNMSIASVIDAGGLDIGYNLWNRTQWNLTRLPFFEANNIYWVPQLESYFDIQAGGAFTDRLVQLRLEGPAPGTELVPVASTTFSKLYRTNGVNGLVFNATAQTLAFTAQNATGSAITLLYAVAPNGTLGGLLRSWGNATSHFGSGSNTSAYPNVESSEHRPTYPSDGPAYAGFWNGWFQNRSWLVDSGTGNWFDTNQTFNHPDPSGYSYKENHLNPSALEGLFLNATYALIPWSYDCRTTKAMCPILGNAATPGGPGTVWWTWRQGAPEFPYANTSGLAQTAPPSDPAGFDLSTFGRTIAVNWTPPDRDGSPLLNYTLFYGTTAGSLNHSLSIPPQATSAEFGAPLPGTLYYVELQAWNLHWHSPGVNGSITTGLLFGSLNVTVQPDTASVTIDGRSTVVSGGSASFVLVQGMHLVNVSAPGYYGNSSVVFVSWENTTTLNVSLVGIPPVLFGSVSPTWAAVELGGAPLAVAGNGSFRIVLTPGPYTITATAEGYVPFGPANVSLAFGDVRNFSIVMGRTMGWIEGLVTPSDAQVTLDGDPISAPNGTFDLELATGLYWLDAFAPGYHPLTVGPINVTYGQVVPEVLSLVPYNGTWNFSVSPADANLSVDGIGVPLPRGHAEVILPPGPHTFVVTRDGYDPFGYSAIVAPNSSTVIVVTLNESVGWIAGSIAPSSAAVSVDGRLLSVAAGGSFNETVLPGIHEVVASAPGYTDQLAAVNVSAHRVTFLRIQLMRPAVSVASPLLTEGQELAILTLAAVVIAGTALLYARRRRTRQRP
ncbi:MAG TPA: fibronectin type III domain-containing protein, partial [Thermoplasmata archaeon]|nr:fibronectin type III domain-containing protein [Thermoplasmata archaeon]